MENQEKFQVKLMPEIPATRLGAMDRAIARIVTPETEISPEGPVQADLYGDTFFSLYRDAPIRTDVPEERAVNAALLNWIRSRPTWNDVQAEAHGSLPAAIATADIIWAGLVTDEAVASALQLQQEAEKARNQAEAMELAAQAMEDQAQAEQMAAQAQELAAQAQQMAAQAAQAVQGMAQNAMSNAVVSGLLRKAQETGGEINAIMRGWGHGPGSGAKLDPREALALVERAASDKLQEIARIAGRLRGLAFEARRQRTEVGITPAGVEFSDDPARIFPEELALLGEGMPAAVRVLQAAELADRGLISYRLESSRKESGPFVALIDESGSMSGTRELVAKGLALGLAQVARQDNREYALVGFSTRADALNIVTSRDGWDAHLAWGEYFQDGGTDFDLAVNQAIRHCKALGQAAQDADVLFITDGEAAVSPHVQRTWEEFRAETGTRAIIVYIGAHYGGFDNLADITLVLDPSQGGMDVVEEIAKSMP